MFNESIPPSSTDFFDQLEHNFQQSSGLIQVISDCAASGDSTFTDPKSVSVTLNHVLKTLSSVEKQIDSLREEIKKSCSKTPPLELVDNLYDNLQASWHITQIVADYAEYADNISPNNRSMNISLNHALELLSLVKKTTVEFWEMLNNQVVKRDAIEIKTINSRSS